MRKSVLEQDVSALIEKIKESDYEIPKNSDVMRVILKRIQMVVVIQIVMIFCHFIIYGYDYEALIGISIISAVGILFFSAVFVSSLYQPVSMMLSINEIDKEGSLIIKLLMGKLKRYWKCLMVINLIIGAGLLLSGEGVISGLGFSWFVTYLICMMSFQMSLSRYMTPAVVSSLSKMKELISASPK
ncbi:protein traS [Cronobacter sakazakii]|nr:protein traS [Cronobacter sakazakii]ELY5804647.1 protein traS [Cronobacter sakazakii]ELY5855234.1 protein traS [Cronobacter malonaticus]